MKDRIQVRSKDGDWVDLDGPQAAWWFDFFRDGPAKTATVRLKRGDRAQAIRDALTIEAGRDA